MSRVNHLVQALNGTLVLELTDGSTCYDLTADSGRGPVTVYLSHHENQDLMGDVGYVITAMGNGTSYEHDVETMAGVINAGDPAGVIESATSPSESLRPDWLSTYGLTVKDGQGGQAVVLLDQAGAESLATGCVLMVGHL